MIVLSVLGWVVLVVGSWLLLGFILGPTVGALIRCGRRRNR